MRKHIEEIIENKTEIPFRPEKIKETEKVENTGLEIRNKAINYSEDSLSPLSNIKKEIFPNMIELSTFKSIENSSIQITLPKESPGTSIVEMKEEETKGEGEETSKNQDFLNSDNQIPFRNPLF